MAKLTKDELRNTIAVITIMLKNTQAALNRVGEAYSTVIGQIQELEADLGKYQATVQAAVAEIMPEWLEENSPDEEEEGEDDQSPS